MDGSNKNSRAGIFIFFSLMPKRSDSHEHLPQLYLNLIKEPSLKAKFHVTSARLACCLLFLDKYSPAEASARLCTQTWLLSSTLK